MGVATHSLPLLIFGYGVLGGVGLGLGYVSPVGTLVRWFPDKRGMATGFAVGGFGGGAMIAAPLNRMLLSSFYVPPDYVGPAESCELITDGGRRFAEVGGSLQEVVVANAADLAAAPIPGLQEGVYLVGTGSTGATETFIVLGGIYFTVIMTSSFTFMVPKEGEDHGSASLCSLYCVRKFVGPLCSIHTECTDPSVYVVLGYV
jgi:hypothetical protein